MKNGKWLAAFFALIAVLCGSTLASVSNGTALTAQFGGISSDTR
jgi:hypothetical protein